MYVKKKYELYREPRPCASPLTIRITFAPVALLLLVVVPSTFARKKGGDQAGRSTRIGGEGANRGLPSAEGFMQQVMKDTTFYHAFLLATSRTGCAPFSVRNKLETATLSSRAIGARRQVRGVGVGHGFGEKAMRERDGDMRYLTAEMYDDVFFPKGRYVAATGSRTALELDRSSRFEKYKSELKSFMFNPGREVAACPMVGDKLDLFDPGLAPFYDYKLDSDYRNGHSCWVFTASAKDTVNGKRADEDDTVSNAWSPGSMTVT